MLESLVTFLVVAAALFFVGRYLYRTVSGNASGCGCCGDGVSCSGAVEPAPGAERDDGSV